MLGHGCDSERAPGALRGLEPTFGPAAGIRLRTGVNVLPGMPSLTNLPDLAGRQSGHGQARAARNYMHLQDPDRLFDTYRTFGL